MCLRARLHVATNSVGQTVLSGVKVRVLCLFVSLDFIENLALLLLSQFFAVNSCVLARDFGQSLRIFRLFDRTLLGRRLLRQLGWLHVVLRRHKVKLDVCLDTANLVVRLGLHDIDRVFSPAELDINRVSFVKD